MFDDPGGKLKAIAKVWFWLVSIASVIVGIWLWSNLWDNEVVISLSVMSGGILFSYVGSLMLYAFGDLAESADAAYSDVHFIALHNINDTSDDTQ